MRQVSYFDMDSREGLEMYTKKSRMNVVLFKALFGNRADPLLKDFDIPNDQNGKQMLAISAMADLPMQAVHMVNVADECLNRNMNITNIVNDTFGCTSVSMPGIVGQTLDLYSIDLTIVRDKDSLYITMPPYLALFGMNRGIAFCTNHLAAPVQKGTPVSHIRRELLRKHTIEDALAYLIRTPKSTSVNFLITDKERTIDVEATPKDTIVHRVVRNDNRAYLAHTNHMVQKDIENDMACPRLTRAFELLAKGQPIKEILSDSRIFLPITPYQDTGVGFGSLIQVIMDVRNGTLTYKDPFMQEYETLKV